MGERGAETSSEEAGLEEAVVEPTSTDAAESAAAESGRDGHAPATDEPDVFEALSRIDGRLAESQRLLDRQHGLVDRLHAENQALRAGELRSAQLPLVRDLLRLHDDLGRMRGTADDDDDLRIVQESLADTLARNGVVAFAPDRDDEFDSRAHSVTGVETTAAEGLDRTVAGVVKQGFRWESGEVIRVAEVTAYRFQDST